MFPVSNWVKKNAIKFEKQAPLLLWYSFKRFYLFLTYTLMFSQTDLGYVTHFILHKF